MADYEYKYRHAEKQIGTALKDSCVVAVVGPRRCGKTTLARRLASNDNRHFLSLDNAQQRRFASDDPDGFLRNYECVVIDEIQRVPELILTIKKLVDENPKPGRYVITGSVDLLQQSISLDSLAGRVEIVELLPFSQAEACGLATPRFIDRLFTGDFQALEMVGRTEKLVERVLVGGYPEAQTRKVDSRRAKWFKSYVQKLLERDLSAFGRINKTEELARLIGLSAGKSGLTLNFAVLAAQLGVDSKTVDRWLEIFEHLFLIRRISAWHQSGRKRLVKSAKLHFVDSGLLAAVRRINASKIQADRYQFEPLLECFVYSEVLKATALYDDCINFSHYRDKDQVEVDLVLERPLGEVVGVEVIARATVRPRDFKGLKRLRDICGKRFVCGVVVHDGDRIQQMSPGMFAIPIKLLWEA